MIERIGKILRGTFFIFAGLLVFGLGLSLGHYGLGDLDSFSSGSSLTGASTTDLSQTGAPASCKDCGCECKLIKTSTSDKCELSPIKK